MPATGTANGSKTTAAPAPSAPAAPRPSAPATGKTVTLGDNVLGKVTPDGKLIIQVDLNQRLRESGSGKNMIIATTGGNQLIPGTDVKVGLNIFTRP